MKSKADEEDYWNSSKFKAFTFDDEDDEFSRVRPTYINTHTCTAELPLTCVSQLKESKRAVNSIRYLVEEDDDEEEVEKVSWSGEPVGSKT